MNEKPDGKIRMTITKDIDIWLSNYAGECKTLGDVVAFEQKQVDEGEADPIEFLDDSSPVEVKFEAVAND